MLDTFSSVRLATFNLLHGRTPADGVVDLNRLVSAIRTLDADILALQEVDRDQPRSHLADLTAVAADAMGAVSHRFVAAVAGTPGATWMAATGREAPGQASYGVALLSRFPARNWQVLRLPRIRPRFPLWLRAARKWIIVHEEPRAVVVGQFDTPLGSVTVANTHLSFVPGWGRLQLQRLRRDLAPQTEPVVIMGDFNMPDPLPARISRYRALATHPTFPQDVPTTQLDHILLRGRFGEVTASEAPELGLSDHRALWVDLTAAEGERG
jgi:endonuclease/exonuclease/phosphatase family metal-dependent hydrolase